MGWRSVLIAHPARLRREHGALLIEQEQTASIPFEDIAVIVLEHPAINLSHPVLAACAEHGIALYCTGDNHQPNGVLLPFLQHTRTTRMLRLQLALPRPMSKQATAALIRRKIENQATCLRLAGKAGDDWLDSCARRVRSGDSGHLEGQAAAFYFPRLFGNDFQREQTRWVNAALNYGYAILRGAIARALVTHGLHPSLGLFHASEQNAFNLADDVIEPYRPLVDLQVQRQAALAGEALLPADKAALVALLGVDVAMPQGMMAALAAIDATVRSLLHLYEHGDSTLDLPQLVGLSRHQCDA